MSFWDIKKLFEILPFYNVLIEKIKYLSNIELLHALQLRDLVGRLFRMQASRRSVKTH